MGHIDSNKPFNLEVIPKELRIKDWGQADPFADTLALLWDIKDYSPVVKFPNLRRLWVWMANERQLQLIGSLTKLRCLNIFWLRSIKDLSPLSGLSNLEDLRLLGNIPGVSLEPLASLTNLKKLAVDALPSRFSGVYLETLDPLGSLTRLEYLSLYGIKTRDDSLAALTNLTNLKRLNVSNYFPIAEFAHLSAALPNTEGLFRNPVLVREQRPNAYRLICKKCGVEERIMLVGRTRPQWACPACNAKHVETHIAEFNRFKAAFQNR